MHLVDVFLHVSTSLLFLKAEWTLPCAFGVLLSLGVARFVPDFAAKKAFGVPALSQPWQHDPAALAQALTIALGQLQSSWKARTPTENALSQL